VTGDVIEYREGGVRVRVTGFGAVTRKLSRAGADSEDMRSLMQHLGSIVVDGAHAPVRSGATAATLRAGRGKTKAVVRAGGARAPGAGVTHYGWPARGIRAQPFLTDALRERHNQVLAALERGIQQLLIDNNLT
jgi:hypothetical protein